MHAREKRHPSGVVRAVLAAGATVAMLVGALAVPALADVAELPGVAAVWLSDPDTVGEGIDEGDPIDGASGRVLVSGDGATIRVHTTGLEHGHAYTMWIAYFNDRSACGAGGCGPADVGGVLFGDGKVAGGSGVATFTARLRTGDGADAGPPPPPFGFAPYEAGPDNELHVVIKSHGPRVPGLVSEQISTFGGACEDEIGPAPGEVGDFPVPSAPGECGEIQLFVFG